MLFEGSQILISVLRWVAAAGMAIGAVMVAWSAVGGGVGPALPWLWLALSGFGFWMACTLVLIVADLAEKAREIAADVARIKARSEDSAA